MSAIVNALRAALDADPNNWESRLALVETYLGEGHTEDAAQVLNEVTVSSGRSCLAAFGGARLLFGRIT